MFRKLILLILPLIAISFFLLFYQWSLYEKGKTLLNKPDIAIKIKQKEKNFIISQIVSQIPSGTYEIKIPKNAEDITCVYDNGKTCVLNERGPTKSLTIASDQKATFNYLLPYDDSKLFFDWFIKLYSPESKELNVNIDLELISYTDPFPKWAAPAELLADIEDTHIRYFAWRRNNVKELPLILLPKATNQSVRLDELFLFFSQGESIDEEKIKSLWKNNKNSVQKPYVMIIDQNEEEQFGKQYAFIKNTEANSLMKAWFKSKLISARKPEPDFKWLIDVISGIYFFEGNLTPQQQALVKEIQEGLSSTELIAWKETLLFSEPSSAAFPTELDQLLKTVVKFPTNFFEQNSVEDKPVSPLYFVDHRKILFNNRETEVNWNSIYFKQKRYFPLAGITLLANYNLVALDEDQSYVVSRNGNTWRFFLNKNTFIHNSESFGVGDDILIRIQGEIFIQEAYLEELLGFSIRNSAESIQINSSE